MYSYIDIQNLVQYDMLNGNAPVVYSENYDNVMDYFDDVEAKIPDYIERLAESEGYDTVESFIDDFKSSDFVYSGYLNMKGFDIRKAIYNELSELIEQEYVDDAREAWPEAYKWPKANYHCNVCKRHIEYDSRDSVMLTDANWNKVIRYYGLTRREKEIMSNKIEWIDICSRRGGIRMEPDYEINMFVCNECMEKALGHKLRKSDMNNSIFNADYIDKYFPE